jgi:hypothetical protein
MSIDVARALSGSKELTTWSGAAFTRATAAAAGLELAF